MPEWLAVVVRRQTGVVYRNQCGGVTTRGDPFRFGFDDQDPKLPSPAARSLHQLRAQEISQLGRRGLKPIVFILNNLGYLTERLLCKNPEFEYNDLAQVALRRLAQSARMRRLVHGARYHMRRI